MRKRTVCFSLVILCLLLFSFTLAWYRNNRQTQVIQTDSISVKGNGVLRTAFATDEDGILQSAEGADYRGELNLRIGDAFENVSGNGLVLYEASLNSNGEPIEEEWKLATADVASQTGDSGQYVTADLYFKSDVPMDIYLLSTSSVAPVTESGGSDLCNNQGYESYTTYSNFGAGGVPVQNINQSSFGLFSRNLIAGATRVAFSEYGYSNEDWTEPDLPNLVWVPNSTFKLTPATDSRVLYRMDISDTPANRESNYTFYSRLNDVGILYTVPRADGVVSGELYVKKNATSSWESVQETVISHTQLVACRQPSGADKPIPQIWVNTANVDAAYCEALDCHVYAQYDGTYGLEKGYALIGKLNNTTVYVRPNEEGTGYVKLQMGSDSRWQTDRSSFRIGVISAQVRRIFSRLVAIAVLSYM